MANMSAISNSKSRKNLNLVKAKGHTPNTPKNYPLSGKGKNSIYLGKDNRGTSTLNASTK